MKTPPPHRRGKTRTRNTIDLCDDCADDWDEQHEDEEETYDDDDA